MKNHYLTLLLLCAWSGAGAAQAQSPVTVGAWGYNYNGQAAVPLAAQSEVMAIAAGSYHTVALKNGGSVMAWGYNAYGQTTVPLAAQSGVMAIAAGYGHTVVLLVTRVALQARRSGNELILSWPTNATGFTLQSVFQLTPSVTWVDVTNPPTLLGSQWTVTNTFSGSAQFYRLRKP